MNIAVLQARLGSKRLPGKVLLPFRRSTLLEFQIGRIRQSRKLDDLVIATTTNAIDEEICKLARRNKVAFYQGSENDVLDRFYHAASHARASVVVRITGDCPLIDPKIIDSTIEYFEKTDADYVANNRSPGYPDGMDVEVFRFDALARAWREAKLPSEREHVTPYLYKNDKIFRSAFHHAATDLTQVRLTVDEPSDYRFINALSEQLGERDDFGLEQILSAMARLETSSMENQDIQRDEGYMISLESEQLARRYEKSTSMLERSQAVIPLGSQTFSKSITQYPKGAAPLFIAKGKGAHVWDIDGNEYVDFVCALSSITIGHADDEVNAAVARQLSEGVIYSLPHPLETEVAELIRGMVPSAQKIRFGKNGSDATAGAVRIARAHTKRDHIAVCGYHGWQDWYIGSTARHLGVPEATRNLTHAFKYNDLDSLRKIFSDRKDQIACVIMEPANVTLPEANFLHEVRDLAHKNGALFVLDETITGFRYAKGGAQEYFKILPDLSTFGKGLANGFPLSALVGKDEYMRHMEDIFFSFTFGGECLSLAAAKATLTKIDREGVIEAIWKKGEQVVKVSTQAIKYTGSSEFLNVSGLAPWSFLNFQDANGYNVWQIKTLFMQEILRRGILIIAGQNLCYAHSDEDIRRLGQAYEEVFGLISEAVTKKTLEKRLLVPTLEPLFRIR